MLGEKPPSALPRQAALTLADTTARRPGLLAAWLFPALVALLGGCAGVHDVTGTASQDDVLQLRGEVAAAQQTAQRARVEAEAAATRAVDARMKSQTVEGQRQIEALNRRLEGLTTSLTELTTRVDDLASRIEALGRQQRGAAPAGPRIASPSTETPPATPTPSTPFAAPSTAGSATARPVTPGSSTAAPSTAGPSTPGSSTAAPSTAAPSTPGPATAAPPLTAGARPSTNAPQPQDIYQAAYIDFSKGSYALAMAGFREFIRRFPDHPLAGNAQYWIGESHFSIARGYANSGQNDKVTPEMELAVQEFRKVIANYPRGEKAPTALYKEALALLELKQPAVAQQRLEYLVSNFPQSEETPLARERLAALKTR
jgi:tol-pal system protein YbgF